MLVILTHADVVRSMGLPLPDGARLARRWTRLFPQLRLRPVLLLDGSASAAAAAALPTSPHSAAAAALAQVRAALHSGMRAVITHAPRQLAAAALLVPILPEVAAPTDAPLTAVGRAQAERLRPAADGLPLELVISSPLTRALETARLAFAAHLARGAPFVAVESCREQIGQNLCDKRQPASLTRPLFPEADMSAIAEADELFTPARETLGALAQRADAFLHEIRGRPEKHIAVVSHSSFFLALFNATLDTARAPELREWFDNGAMRVAHVAYD